MRWEELSVPEIEALDRDGTVLDPAARLGRAAWPPPAARHRHDARARACARGGGAAPRARRGAAAALVRILAASHALSPAPSR